MSSTLVSDKWYLTLTEQTHLLLFMSSGAIFDIAANVRVLQVGASTKSRIVLALNNV